MRQTIIALVAILCIAGLEALALKMGLNATLLTLSVGAIAGIAGYQLKAKKKGG